MTRFILSAMLLLCMALSSVARESSKQDFLNTLFKGRNYPVALSQSEAYPWVIDNNYIKTSSRQDDVNSNSWFALDVFVPNDSASVSFDYQVRYHKETYGWAKYANLTCSIDGVEVFSNNGTDRTESTTIKIAHGYHQLKWNLSLGEAWENWDYFGRVENMRFDGISDESPLPEFDRLSVPFYNVKLNTLSEETISITNIGNKPYVIQSIDNIVSPFRIIKGESQTIAPGATETIIIGFEPEYDGYYDCEMVLSSNLGKTLIPVSGISTDGYLVVSPIPGGLSSVLKNTNCESVVIMGHLNRTDQYYLNKLQKCKHLNLAGTDIEVVTNGGINNLWKLKSIVLPKTLKVLDTTWANNSTFEGKTQVTLYDLTCIQCLSPTPPKVLEFYGMGGNSEEKELGNLRASTRLLVPMEHLNNYTSSKIWNKLTIIPTTEERATLRINLEVNNPQDYTGAQLHLRNLDTRESSFLTLNGNPEYSFTGLHPYYLYNVTLTETASGRNIGSCDVTELDIPESTISLKGVKALHKIKAAVYDDKSKNVTSDIDLEWIGENGHTISTSAIATGVLSEDSITCKINLSESLGKTYINPRPISLRVPDCDSTIVVQLEHIPTVTIKGRVKNAVYNTPIENASILVNQYLNGKYANTHMVSSDSDGSYSLELKNDSTLISVIAQKFEPHKFGLTNLTDSHRLEEILLQPEEGVTVNLQLSFQHNAESGTEPTIDNWYSDYANIDFSAFNKTTGMTISRKDYKWPTLTLLENCAIGDSIIITASSMNDAFYPINAVCVIDSLAHADISITIVELGSIRSEYSYSGNQTTTGLLFGPDSKLIGCKSYLTQKVSFDNLKDGKYSLVTMGADRYYNSIPSLNTLQEYQLNEGTDYVIHEVEVVRGVICNIKCDSIPTFDTESHRLTDSSTYFLVNKSSVVAGNYVTIDTKVGFNSAIAPKAKNVNLIIELPSGTSFVKNSLLVGGSQSNNYKIDGTQLIIPIQKTGERIRFCLQPSSYGNYTTGGSVKFCVDDKEYIQPIGTASFSATSITLSAPSYTPYKEIVVGGNTIANAEVTLYDNDIAVGKTDASASGKWQTTISLNNPYNHSRHHIYAKIESSDGLEMQSETKNVVYDRNKIVVKQVTMYHDNPEVGRTFSVVFDFLNPSPVTSSYTYYIYNKNFTFTIDLTDNDPEKVTDVVLWVTTGKGNEIGLDAKYDETQGLWVASGQFGNLYDGDIPVNVAVSLNQSQISEIDSDAHNKLWKEFVSNITDLQNIDSYYDALFDELTIELNSNQPNIEHICEIIKLSTEGYGGSLEYLEEGSSIEEVNALVAELTNDLLEDSKKFRIFPETVYGKWDMCGDQYIEHIEILKISDFDKANLDSFDNLKIQKSAGGSIELYTSDDKQIVIDAENDYVIVLAFEAYNNIRSLDNKPFNLFESIIQNFALNSAQQLLSNYEAHRLLFYSSRADKLSSMIATLSRTELDKDIIIALTDVHKAYREIAKKVKKNKVWLSKLSSITALYANLSKYLSEQQSLLKLADELADGLLDCAIQKYPQECAEIYENLSEFYKRTPNRTRKKIFIPTVSATGGFISSMILGVVSDACTDALSNDDWNTLDNYAKQIYTLNSTCIKEERQRLIDEGYFKSNCPDAPNQIDPSGYVYETVPSNRLQGVKATCYQKVETENMYGDIIEKAIIWDARNYEQKNPLITDEQGLYRWDVPEGLWQVKFEKDGYETTYSDWLPVPPPQLEINVPMVQYSQPDVIKTEWNNDGIEIFFDKYMLPSTINKKNIIVEFNGQDICGDIVFINEEAGNDNNELSFASTIRITPSIQLAEKDVIDLVIKGGVKSYAGIALGVNRAFKLSRVPTLTEFVTPDTISMKVNTQQTIHVQALSKDAAKGKALSISNSSPLICAVDDSLTLDDNAEGDIYLTGSLPGASTLTLSIDGFNKKKQIAVIVSDINDQIVATPYASVDGSQPIVEGSEIFLFCDTDGATIYYTIDGSCPCDYNTRIKYDGTPIVVNKPMELRAMACKPGLEDSETVTYLYENVTSSVTEIKYDMIYSISPKTTKDYVYLNVINGGMASRVSVWDINGGLIQTKTNVPDGSRINLGKLPTGMYIITVDINGHSYSDKVVKM